MRPRPLLERGHRRPNVELKHLCEARNENFVCGTLVHGESATDYRGYADALQNRGHLLDDVYTHKCIHSALGYLTPAAFEQQRHIQQTASLGVHLGKQLRV